MEYQEYLHNEGLKPTKYIVGDPLVDGHTHIIYVRDDLPISTTSAPRTTGGQVDYHAHSIEDGVSGLVCLPAGRNAHIHTVFTLVP